MPNTIKKSTETRVRVSVAARKQLQDAGSVEAGMRAAYSIGVMDLAAAEAAFGKSMRGLLPSVDALLAHIGVSFSYDEAGDPVGFLFTRTNADGEVENIGARYDAQGVAALRDATVLLHPSAKGVGEKARTTPEEQLVRRIRAALLANDHLLDDLLPEAGAHPTRKKWRDKHSLAAANRIAKAIINEALHFAIDRHPDRLGPYVVTKRHRPLLRGVAAASCLSDKANAQRMTQIVEQRPWALLFARRLEEIAGLRTKAALGALELENADGRLTEDGVATLAFHLRVRGQDIDVRKLRKILPAEVARLLPRQGAKQRLMLNALARAWLSTENERRVRELGLWLGRELALLPKATDISSAQLSEIVDYAGVGLGRIAELKRLYAGDAERAAALVAFNSAMSLDDALHGCARLVDAIAEEERLLQARVLDARIEAERQQAQRRLVELRTPFKVKEPFPSGTIRVGKTRLRLQHLETETMLIAEGAAQRNCLSTKAANAREGREHYYSIIRRLTKNEREDPELRKGLRVRAHPELGDVAVLGDVSFVAAAPDELRITEIKGWANAPVAPHVAFVMRKEFPRK